MIAGLLLAVWVWAGLPPVTATYVVAQTDAPSGKAPENDAQKAAEQKAAEAQRLADVLKPPADSEQALQKWNDLRTEYDRLQAKAEDLARQLETAQQDIAGSKKAVTDLNARLATLEKEKGQAASALTEARDQAKDLAAKLAAEQVKAGTLREEKQRLMSGATTAKEEIVRLQKRASELETEAARADNLAQRLAERDQEIEKLRKAASDRETLANKVGTLTDKLERAKQRVQSLTDELNARSEEALRARQERDQLLMELQKTRETAKGGDLSLPLMSPAFPDKPADRLKLDTGPRSDRTVKPNGSKHDNAP